MRCRRCGVVKRVEKPSSIKAPPSIPKTSLPSREGSGKPLNKTEDDGDQHGDGNAALYEYMPNFAPDDWDENLLEAFRRIVEDVNRLREGRPFRNIRPLRSVWDEDDDDVVAALLAQVDRAIEQLRAAMEDGEPLPSADFVFRFDESIINDDLIVFVRRIQVVLNGLRTKREKAVSEQIRKVMKWLDEWWANGEGSYSEVIMWTWGIIVILLASVVVTVIAFGVFAGVKYFAIQATVPQVWALSLIVGIGFAIGLLKRSYRAWLEEKSET